MYKTMEKNTLLQHSAQKGLNALNNSQFINFNFIIKI